MSNMKLKTAEKDEIKAFLEKQSFNVNGEHFTIESLKILVAYAIKLVFEKYRDDSHKTAGNNAGIVTSIAAAIPTGGISLVSTPIFHYYSSKHEKLRSPYVNEIKNLQSVYNELTNYDKEIKVFNIHQQDCTLTDDLQITNESVDKLDNSLGFKDGCFAYNIHYEIGNLSYIKPTIISPHETSKASKLQIGANLTTVATGVIQGFSALSS